MITTPTGPEFVKNTSQSGAKSGDHTQAIDFQFDSTVDGKAIKIASMIDEHTRVSVLNIVERSITADRLVAELRKVFAAAGGPPQVLRMDNGPEFISPALQQFCDRRVGMSYIPPGTPWNNFGIDQFDVNTAHTPLNGFLAGLLLGFDPSHAADLRASYRIKVDGRIFDFSVDGGELTAGRDALAVTVEATADDLITARLAPEPPPSQLRNQQRIERRG